MKFILIVMVLAFAGCMRADLETITYQDPGERFKLEYPTDWAVTKSHDEVQFWDTPEEPTIKMALFEAGTTNFDEFIADDESRFDELQDIPIMIRTGSFMSDYQIYYYNLETEIVGFSAYFSASTPGHFDQVTEIQRSFQAM